MASNLDKTGVFYFQTRADGVVAGSFPEELRHKRFADVEPRFLALFFGTLFLVGTTVLLLSYTKYKKNAADEAQEILKIQERYASLVLNRELPEPVKEEKPFPEAAGGGLAGQTEPLQEEEAVKEAEVAETEAATKETVTERQVRKSASSSDRAAKRESLKKGLDNVGLFAELTAVGNASGGGGRGSSRAVQDLVGDIGSSGASLSNISNAVGAGGGGFVSSKSSANGSADAGSAGGFARRGERAEGGSIKTATTSSAAVSTIKSEGTVSMSSVGKVQGDAAADASRDMKSLAQTLKRYEPRIIKVYEDYLKRNPDISGKFVVKFTIEADGTISDLVVVSSQLKEPELEKELLRWIGRIRFQSASGKVSIEYPLVFSKS